MYKIKIAQSGSFYGQLRDHYYAWRKATPFFSTQSALKRWIDARRRITSREEFY